MLERVFADEDKTAHKSWQWKYWPQLCSPSHCIGRNRPSGGSRTQPYLASSGQTLNHNLKGYGHTGGWDKEQSSAPDSLTKEPGGNCDEEVPNVEATVLMITIKTRGNRVDGDLRSRAGQWYQWLNNRLWATSEDMTYRTYSRWPSWPAWGLEYHQ